MKHWWPTSSTPHGAKRYGKASNKPHPECAVDLGAGEGDLDLAPANTKPGKQEVVSADNALSERLRKLFSYRQSGHDFNPE
jgi:hypothetical protein